MCLTHVLPHHLLLMRTANDKFANVLLGIYITHVYLTVKKQRCYNVILLVSRPSLCAQVETFQYLEIKVHLNIPARCGCENTSCTSRKDYQNLLYRHPNKFSHLH